MDIINLKIEDLQPYEHNARHHEEKDLEAIEASIREFGFNDPIGIWGKKNIIVEGHGRLMAAKNIGLQEVPCIRLDHLTDEQRRAYALAHNKTAELSRWDFDVLDAELAGIEELDMSAFGFDQTQPEDPEDIVEDIPPDEDEVEGRCQRGQVWQLGEHRLMCGDSTNPEDVYKLMGGAEKADMVFTDPPYGMGKEKDGVLNDNLNLEDLLEFNRKWIPLSFDALKDNGSWYCWGIDEPLMDIYSNILKPMAKAHEVTFRNLITWDKGYGQGQLSSGYMKYAIADEKCLFVMCGVQCLTLNADQYWDGYEPIRQYLYSERCKCGWDVPMMKKIAGHSDRSRDHWTGKSQWELPTKKVYLKFQKWAKENGVDAFGKEYEQLKEEYEQLRACFDNTHDNMNDVWHFERTGKDERKHTGGHATPKPIALCARAIKTSSRKGEKILDLFGGSGSTMIAAEQLGRRCYMMELDPHYCDVIITRWEEFTGKEARLINGTREVEEEDQGSLAEGRDI